MIIKKWILLFTFVFAIFMLMTIWAPVSLDAQCPMCRLTAEGNLKEGGMAGAGLNLGILYMLSGPYILFGSIAYIWWRRNGRADDQIIRNQKSSDYQN